MMVDFLAWASIVSIVFIGAIVVMSLYYYIIITSRIRSRHGRNYIINSRNNLEDCIIRSRDSLVD